MADTVVMQTREVGCYWEGTVSEEHINMVYKNSVMGPGNWTREWIDYIVSGYITGSNLFLTRWKYSFVAECKAGDLFDSVMFVRKNLLPWLNC